MLEREKDMKMFEMINKLNTAIALIGDARRSLENRRNYEAIAHFVNEEQLEEYKLSKEDSKESIIRRLVVVRGMLNEINRELKGGK